MQKSVIIVGIIIVIAIAGYALLGSQKQDNTEKQGSDIKWYTDLNAAFQQAQNTNKPIFIDFFASWCSPCQQLDKNTFSNQQVKDKLSSKYVTVKIDVDKNPDLVSKYKIYGYPTMVFLNPDGTEIKRIDGYVDHGTLLNQL